MNQILNQLRRFPASHLVATLSWLNFAALWLVIALIHGVSEKWWLSIVILYLPRIPWIIPTLVLIPIAFRYSWKSGLVNVASVLLVLGPIMNWQCGGVMAPVIDSTAPRLTIVSCNVQSFRPDFDAIVTEINRLTPDVVLFQEAFEDHELLATLFDGWNVHRVDEYLAASRWPLTYLDKCEVGTLDRTTLVRYEVKTPSGPVRFCNVHLISPRHTLTQLKPWSIFTGTGIDEVEEGAILRDVETLKAREFTGTQQRGVPTVIAGDFNMPNDSSLFRKHWSDLTDTYATVGVGYGYTSPCQTRTSWPTNTPWAQVDHILATPGIQVEKCWVGHSAGSDHRLIAAQFRLPATAFAETSVAVTAD